MLSGETLPFCPILRFGKVVPRFEITPSPNFGMKVFDFCKVFIFNELQRYYLHIIGIMRNNVVLTLKINK